MKNKRSQGESQYNSTNKNDKSVELSVLLEEYKSLREEIISIQEYTRHTVTTTFAGIAAFCAVSPYIITHNFQIAFLVFPYFFYGLSLISTKYALASLSMGNYIKSVLTPHVQKCLSQIDNQKDYEHIFIWERNKGFVKKYGLFFLPANGASYWLPLLTAILFICVYFLIPPSPRPSAILELVLLGINLIFVLYAIIVGLYAGYSR